METNQNVQVVPKKEARKDKGSKTACPDQGWAWVVATAACTINFIMAGLVRMSGILFVAFIEIFQVDRKSASMPFSVRSSAGNLFGPVVGILGQKYGVRKVIITGCVIGTISAATCFFAPNVMGITVLWGGINGLGSALTVTLPQVVIGQHFDKYRTTAAGMAYSGGCIGSFLFPVLLEYLLHNYGIQGTFLIISGILMHTIPAALILRKPQWLKSKIIRNPSTPKSTVTQSISKAEQDSIVKTNVYSVSECTPKRTPVKACRRDLLKEGGFCNFELTKCRVKLVNECSTPKRTLNDSKVCFGLYPDVQYLKENSDLVRQLLTMDTTESIKTTSNERKAMEKFLEANIVDIIDCLYDSVLTSQNKSRFHKNLRQVKSTLFKEQIKSDVKFNSNQSAKLHKSLLSKTNSAPVKSNESNNVFIINKVSELDGIDEQQLVSKFPGNKDKIASILHKLQKLCKLCPKEQKRNILTTPSKILNREKISYVKTDAPSNSLMHHVATAFKLYSNPLFLMVCLCRAVHFLAFIPSMTTVVDFSMDKGLQEDEGKFAIAVISIGDLVGRLCFGWVTDRGFVTLPKYMMIVMVLQGISTAALPLLNSKITIFTCLSLYGMLQGSLFVRHPVLISRYMRKHEQSIAMGCANLLSGVIGFGLPLYIGFFRDTLGSYDYVFYINGLFGACVGLLWVLEPFFVRFVNGKRTSQKITV